MILHVLRISHWRNNAYGLSWFSINHVHVKSKCFKHAILIGLDFLTSNGLIIKSCYYDFNDTACIVNISVEITLMVYHGLSYMIHEHARLNLKLLNMQTS